MHATSRDVVGCSLPPLVTGPAKGRLEISLERLSWRSTAPEGHLQARVHWWGDERGGDELPLDGDAGGSGECGSRDVGLATIHHDLHTGPRYLSRYLKDCGSLSIMLERRSGSNASASSSTQQAVGRVTIGLLGLEPGAMLTGAFPIAATPTNSGSTDSSQPGGGADIIGSLHLSMRLHYDPSLVGASELQPPTAGAAAALPLPATDGGASVSSASTDGQQEQLGEAEGSTTRLRPPPGLFLELDAAVAADGFRQALRKVLGSCAPVDGDAPGGATVLDGTQLLQLLATLLPQATPTSLAYAFAALLAGRAPTTDAAGREATERVSMAELRAAAAECAGVEAALRQDAHAAVRPLRQAAAAISSKTLELVRAFSALAAPAEGAAAAAALGTCARQAQPHAALRWEQVPALLRGLHPSISAGEMRLLLAVLAGSAEHTLPKLEVGSAGAGGDGAAAPPLTGAAAGVTLVQLKAALSAVEEAQAFPTAEEVRQQQEAAAARQVKLSVAAAAAASSTGAERRRRETVNRLRQQAQQRRASLGAEPQVATWQESEVAAPAAAAPAPAASAVVEGSPFTLPAVPEEPARPQPMQQQQQQQATAGAEDPLLALIRRAEQLKQAMQHASLAPAGGAPLLAPLPLPGAAVPALAVGTNDAATLSAASAALLQAAQALRQQAAAAPGAGADAGAAQPPAAPVGLPLLAGPGPAAASGSASVPAAEAGSSSLALSDSDGDPAELAADVILQELFFSGKAGQQQQQLAQQQSSQQQEHRTPSGEQQGSACSEAKRANAGLLLSLQLSDLRLAASGGDDAPAASVRCVVKPLQVPGSAGPTASAAAHQPLQFTLPVAASGAVHVDVPVAPPPSAGAPQLAPFRQRLALPPYLFCELWTHGGRLLGLVRAPLVAPPPSPPCPASGDEADVCAAQLAPAVVCCGRQQVWDPLAGAEAGTLHLAAVLQEEDGPRVAPATRHCFTVSVRQAFRLPSPAAYADARLLAPDTRFVRYSFPGEPEALRSGEVAAVGSPAFEASAKHELALPAGQALAPLLQEGHLSFEVWDRWLGASGCDQQERCHAWALLPLRELAALAAAAAASEAADPEPGACASRSCLLPLTTEWGGEAGLSGQGSAAERGPALRVDLSYKAESCVMDVTTAAAVAAAAAQHSSQRLQQDLPPLLPSKPAAAPPAAAAAVGAAPAAAVKRAHTCQSSSSSSSSDSEEADENSLPRMNSSSRRRGSRRPATTQQRARQRQQPRGPAPRDTVPLAAAALPSPPPPRPEPAVEAVLSVEVVRACGLAAAVRAAAAGAGGAVASSLARAKSSGPHAFARLSLFRSDADASLQQQAPPLQTAFVPQSCTPAWHAQHSFRLRLTGGMLAALASQELCCEVWHHCPRSDAAVAALAAGRSSTAADSGPGATREVLLGKAACSLAAVLARRRGLRCWLPLVPAIGAGSVGAVQIAVRLAQLAGVQLGDEAEETAEEEEREEGAWSLLDCAPDVAALLPAPLRTRLLLPAADPLAAGFLGQQALLRVCIQEVALPQAGSSRPKAAKFFACLTLPPAGSGSGAGGGGMSVTTATRTATAVDGGGVPGQQEQWAARLGHTSWFQVVAGQALHHVLLTRPLTVNVYKQQPAAAGPAPTRAATAPATHVGTAEVELWRLLLPSSGERVRRASGRSAVVDAGAATLGAAAVVVEVDLVLEPHAAELAAADQRWALGEEEEEEEEEEQQQQQQGVPTELWQWPAGSKQQEFLEEAVAGGGGEDGEGQAAEVGERQTLTAGASHQGASETGSRRPVSGVRSSGEDAGGEGEPQVQQAEEMRAAVPPAGLLLLQIDTALHLPPAPAALAAAGDSGYCCWVQAVWAPQRQWQQRTPAVPVHFVDAAGMGGTAVWNAQLELPVPAASFASASALGGSKAAPIDGPLLLLNVWSTSTASSSGGSAAVPSSRPSSAAGAADVLIGCAAVDVAVLPALGEIAGWWHIVDSQQGVQGQLKAAVRPDAVLAAQLVQQREERQQLTQHVQEEEPAAACSCATAAAGAAGAPAAGQQGPAQSGGEEAGAPDAASLQRLLQEKLSELESLSRQLAASDVQGGGRAAAVAASPVVKQQPWKTEPDREAGATSAGSPACAQQQEEEEEEAEAGGHQEAAPQDLPAAGPASDDEDAAEAAAAAALAVAQAEFGRLQAGRTAWSGSDSDDGCGALVGVAFEGAVSPGFTDEEEAEDAEEELPQDRQPPRPVLLLADDWLFAISRQAPVVLEQAAGGGGESHTEEQVLLQHFGGALQLSGGQASSDAAAVAAAPAAAAPAAPAPVVRFRNRLPSAVVEELPSMQPLSPEEWPGMEEAAAAAPAALPAMALPPPIRRHTAAAVRTASPLQPAAASGGGGGALQQADWMFDIAKRPQLPSGIPAAATSSAAQYGAAAMSGCGGSLAQFAPMTEEEVLQCAQEQAAEAAVPLQQAQQLPAQPRSPLAAATFDEVLASIRSGAPSAEGSPQAAPLAPVPAAAPAPGATTLPPALQPYLTLSPPVSPPAAAGGPGSSPSASSSCDSSLPPPRRPFTAGPSRFALAAAASQPAQQPDQAA